MAEASKCVFTPGGKEVTDLLDEGEWIGVGTGPLMPMAHFPGSTTVSQGSSLTVSVPALGVLFYADLLLLFLLILLLNRRLTSSVAVSRALLFGVRKLHQDRLFLFCPLCISGA